MAVVFSGSVVVSLIVVWYGTLQVHRRLTLFYMLSRRPLECHSASTHYGVSARRVSSGRAQGTRSCAVIDCHAERQLADGL